MDNGLPAPPSGGVNVNVNTGWCLFEQTVGALLQTLHTLAQTDQSLDHMLGAHKQLFNSQNTAMNLIHRISNGIPEAQRRSIAQGTFTLQDLANLPEIKRGNNKSGIYIQLYQMPGNKRDMLRIGSTNNFSKRAGEHRRKLEDPTETGMSFIDRVTLKSGTKCVGSCSLSCS